MPVWILNTLPVFSFRMLVCYVGKFPSMWIPVTPRSRRSSQQPGGSMKECFPLLSGPLRTLPVRPDWIAGKNEAQWEGKGAPYLGIWLQMLVHRGIGISEQLPKAKTFPLGIWKPEMSQKISSETPFTGKTYSKPLVPPKGYNSHLLYEREREEGGAHHNFLMI